jgi:hypothetical protein
VAAVNGYVTNTALRARGGFDAIPDSTLDDAITAASRVIDQHCARRFWADTTATAREYAATRAWELDVDDFHTTTDLVVKTDDDNNGAFETTWTLNTDYILKPRNGIVDGIEGWPYLRVVRLANRSFPTAGPRSRVQVTAKWGWAAVPAVVEHVCVDLVRRALFADTGIQSEQTGSYQVAYDFVGLRQLVSDGHRALLAPYRKVGVA